MTQLDEENLGDPERKRTRGKHENDNHSILCGRLRTEKAFASYKCHLTAPCLRSILYVDLKKKKKSPPYRGFAAWDPIAICLMTVFIQPGSTWVLITFHGSTH